MFIRLFTIGSRRLSLSYVSVNNDSFFTPLSITGESSSNGTILVYLPNFSYTEILKVLKSIDTVKFRVYYDCSSDWTFSKNIEFKKINSAGFMKDFLECSAVITQCGFSTTCEAIYLKKPLWAISIRGQFEQEFNSKILKSRGVFTHPFNSRNLNWWLESKEVSTIEIVDDLERLIKRIITIYDEN